MNDINKTHIYVTQDQWDILLITDNDVYSLEMNSLSTIDEVIFFTCQSEDMYLSIWDKENI